MARTTADSVTSVTKFAGYVPVVDLGVFTLTQFSGVMEPTVTIFVGAESTLFMRFGISYTREHRSSIAH